MNQKRTRMTFHPVTQMRQKGWRMQNSKMRISRRRRQDPAASASEQSKLVIAVQIH